MWEQYIRDLAVFGTNAIELIPPRSDDAADSPHFPLPQIDTMIGMSRICDEYGLDVWIWYPAMDENYADPKTVEFALNEWGEVFKKLPRVDAVFVPGGDPGHTQPQVLMALLEKQTANLHRFHPKATMWVAPQSFSEEWMNEFLEIVTNRAEMAQRDRLRTADAPVFAATASGHSQEDTHSATIPTSRTAATASFPCRTGTPPSP